MSSKSTSRNSSPRAMPVETIITRFKSAQQKRQLREMDRGMSKVTELLKNPVKPKVRKKGMPQKAQKANSPVAPEEDKRKRVKKVHKTLEKVEVADEEYYPTKLKRHIMLNKVQLKPKHEMKVIARTNKRKRSMPCKGLSPQDNYRELSCDSLPSSRDQSPKLKRSRPSDMTMDDMIQLIEDSRSLDDEELLEILTCPSPVWWEDPPDGYVEDALFTRPRSSAEMYPSIRSQLEENYNDRKRSNTPNVLSRRERVNGKRGSKAIEVTRKEVDISNNNNDIALGINLANCDERFKKKRSKLESVLGNLKNKTISKCIDKVSEPAVGCVSDSKTCYNFSGLKNLSRDKNKTENNKGNVESNTDKKSSADELVCIETDPENTDDEHLTDISISDDVYLNDLENMDIPMQENKDLSKNLAMAAKDKDENICDSIDLTTESSPKKVVETNLKESSVDTTIQGKKSSILEDYLVKKLIEADTDNTVCREKNNEGSENIPLTSSKCEDDCRFDSNLTSCRNKFQSSNSTSLSVVNIDGVVPQKLPPLKNSDKRECYKECIPEKLPPLRRNPGGVQKTVESLKSKKNPAAVNTPESSSNVLMHDNMDSISDTNICFLNDDEEDIEKKIEVNNDLEIASVTKDKFHQSSLVENEDIPKNEMTRSFSESKPSPANEMNCNHDLEPNEKLLQKRNEVKALEVQNLNIAKVNDANTCKANEHHSVETTDDDFKICNEKVQCDTEKLKNDDNLTPAALESYVVGDLGYPSANNATEEETVDSAECITVYKIITDDSGSDELSKPDEQKDVTNTAISTNNLNEDQEDRFDGSDKYDKNRDTMGFYFKKCKNINWKRKSLDKNVESNESVEQGISDKDKITTNTNKESEVDKIDSSNSTVNNIVGFNVESDTENTNKQISKNNTLEDSTGTSNNEQKCIVVSNTNQIRYCMKCSSIFDTKDCNYCIRINKDTNSKPQHTQGDTDCVKN